MTVPLAPLAEREKRSVRKTRSVELGSVNDILLASYRRFARDPHTRVAVKLYLERRGKR